MSRAKKPRHRSPRRESAPPATSGTTVVAAPFHAGRAFGIAGALAALTMALFWSLRTADFIGLDDPGYVRTNPHIIGGFSTPALAWAWTTGYAANWHPLTWMSHMLDVEMFGLWAGGHHLTNVVLHAINAALLFVVLYRTTGAIGRSVTVAALFAAHPMHVESVAWIAERKDVLSTLFWLGTMLAYAGWTRRPVASRYLLTCLWFTAGLLSKPMLVSLPFVLVLFDLWPLGRWDRTLRGLRPRIIEKLPLFALAAASSLVTLVVQQRGGAMTNLDLLPLPTRAANAVVAYMRYLGKLFWPTDMAIFYPYREALPAWWALASLAMLVALSVMAYRARRDRAYLTTGWFWFAGTLVPVIGLVQVGTQAIADRYTYVPYIGAFIGLVWMGAALAARLRVPALATGAVAAVVVAACAAVTAAQLPVWQNNGTVWRHAAAVTTGNYVALNEVGMLLAAETRHSDALQYFEQSARDKPSFPEARNNLGLTYQHFGRLQDALAQYELALRLKPSFPEAEHNYGFALMSAGRLDEAERHLRRAIQLRPEFPAAYHSLGMLLASQMRVGEAIDAFKEAVRLDPRNVSSRFTLGMAYGAGNRLTEAAAAFNEVLRLDPNHPAAKDALQRIDKMRTGKVP